MRFFMGIIGAAALIPSCVVATPAPPPAVSQNPLFEASVKPVVPPRKTEPQEHFVPSAVDPSTVKLDALVQGAGHAADPLEQARLAQLLLQAQLLQSDFPGKDIMQAGGLSVYPEVLLDRALDVSLNEETRDAFFNLFLHLVENRVGRSLIPWARYQALQKQITASSLSLAQKRYFERYFVLRASIPYVDFRSFDSWQSIIANFATIFGTNFGIPDDFSMKPLWGDYDGQRRSLGIWIMRGKEKLYLLKFLFERGREEANHLLWVSRYLENYDAAKREKNLPNIALPECVFAFALPESDNVHYAALLHVAKGDPLATTIMTFVSSKRTDDAQALDVFYQWGRQFVSWLKYKRTIRHGDLHAANVLFDGKHFSLIDMETAVWSFLDQRLSDTTKERHDFYHKKGPNDWDFFLETTVNIFKRLKDAREEHFIEAYQELQKIPNSRKRAAEERALFRRYAQSFLEHAIQKDRFEEIFAALMHGYCDAEAGPSLTGAQEAFERRMSRVMKRLDRYGLQDAGSLIKLLKKKGQLDQPG